MFLSLQEMSSLLTFMMIGTAGPMMYILYQMNYYNNLKGPDGQWTKPTLIGSDGRVYYAKPEE